VKQAAAPVRAALCALLLCTVLIPAGCRSTGAPVATPGDPTPDYAEVAAAYNARVVRLERIWARAVVQIIYTDENERRRTTQGEGHLQIIQPARLALSVGKLSEVHFWLGADDERFWVFELADASRVSVGRHENVGAPCARDLALPVHPLDLLDLLGVTTLPEPGAQPAPAMAWSSQTGLLTFELPARMGVRRLSLDPASFEPVRIELLPASDAPPVVVSELENYDRVTLRDAPGYNPRMASRIVVTHPESESEIRMSLYDAEDGKSQSGRLAPPVFRLDTLMRAYAPRTIDVLDADCPRPALAPPLSSARPETATP
jgi:hypothetical protein